MCSMSDSAFLSFLLSSETSRRILSAYPRISSRVFEACSGIPGIELPTDKIRHMIHEFRIR